MKHYILLGLKDGQPVEEVAEQCRAILTPVPKELEGAGEVRVYTNCVDRPENLDLMIEIPLTDASVLSGWAEHPRHRELIAYAGPKAQSKLTFDCMD